MSCPAAMAQANAWRKVQRRMGLVEDGPQAAFQPLRSVAQYACYDRE